MKNITIQLYFLVLLVLVVGCVGNDNTITTDSTGKSINDTGAVMSGDINVGTTMKDSLNEMNGTSDSGNEQNDQSFVIEAAKGGVLEVAMGKLAATNSSSVLLKDLGQMMVTDHTKANNELKILASKKGIKIPSSLDDKGLQHMNLMKAMKGKDFDEAYLNMMVADHNQDIAKFEDEISRGNDNEVKSFATATLLTLKKHQKKIKEIQEKMK